MRSFACWFTLCCGVSAIGASHAGNNIANIAYMTLRFPNNVIAHFHVNWLAPVKIRQTLLGCSKPQARRGRRRVS